MAYRDFTFQLLKKQFGLTEGRKNLFPSITTVEPSAWLLETLEISHIMPYTTEKMRSERIISPILMEVARKNQSTVALFSGHTLSADPQTGLNGECDFILAQGPASIEITSPILAVVEAKKGDIESALPQCGAQMLGAMVYSRNEGHEPSSIFGCITTGTDWLFLHLQNNVLYIDQNYYFFDRLPILLGVFQSIINQTRPTAPNNQ